MLRHLVNHALQNVWCSPRQDNLHILQLHKLTAKYGVLTDVKVMGRDIPLPNTKNRFHVYQIGQISPQYLGALAIKPTWLSERWTSFSTAINANNTQIDIYTEKGVMFPRFRTYYMMTKDRNLIVAVEFNKNLTVDLDTESVFIRFYKNAFFRATEGLNSPEKLFHVGDTPNTASKLTALVTKYNQYKALNGYVTCFVNGFVVDAINAFNAKVNDCVEFLYDSTIYKVLTVDIATLPVFTSTLDDCLKYILHHQSLGEEYINYQDDIDIDVIYTRDNSRFRGTYYHRNLISSHTMITHRDYAVPVDHVRRSMDYIKDLITTSPRTLEGYKLRVKVKETNAIRPLIFDNNRIFELYKLKDTEIIEAMTGTNATVDNWKASTLEHSYYTKIMGMKADDIDISTVQQAYGYNSVTKITADSPIRTEFVSSRQQAILPLAYRINSQVYEYDQNGLMLGSMYVDENDIYYAASNNCKMIEPIVGKALPNNGDVFGSTDLAVPAFDYRVYKTYSYAGLVNNEGWMDITGDSSLYEVHDGVLTWVGPQNDNHWLCIRSETFFYAKDYEVESVMGVISFKLTETINGVESDMSIPRGEIDLFINDKSSIHTLDYIVDFPNVYINNVNYLNRPLDSSKQNIHVRMTGFCKSDMTFEPIDDFGFVRHAALSDNHVFNIRDDKVLRITADGKLYHRSDLLFDETNSTRDVINSLNGKPYQIRDYVIPIRDLVDDDTYSYRDKSLAIDKAISDYLTLMIPSADKGPISAIATRYRVVSPFLSRVIYKLANDNISDNTIAMGSGDAWIMDLLKIDEHLLAADPIRDENRYSDNNVIVVPHYYNTYITLSVLKFRFLTRVVQLYSQADIELTQFVLVNKEL